MCCFSENLLLLPLFLLTDIVLPSSSLLDNKLCESEREREREKNNRSGRQNYFSYVNKTPEATTRASFASRCSILVYFHSLTQTIFLVYLCFRFPQTSVLLCLIILPSFSLPPTLSHPIFYIAFRFSVNRSNCSVVLSAKHIADASSSFTPSLAQLNGPFERYLDSFTHTHTCLHSFLKVNERRTHREKE